ncbi:acyltransferase [Paraburkholderia sp. JHI869]|uniref:acyltransferase family protein n=1 Tax=Paraburkholderia sp. JHI869 TaxID=3112959 RepID=UPI0031748D27
MKTTIKSLEGLRGVAAVLVVLHHMFYSPPNRLFANGYLAVDLFFVLSGFIICRTYADELTDGVQIAAFVLRRFGRLWPVYAITGVIAVAASFAFHLPTLGDAFSIISLTQGLGLFSPSTVGGVSWSASDEFYVYLLFAALCFTFRRKSRNAAFLGLAFVGYVAAVDVSLHHSCLQRGGCLGSLTGSYGWIRCVVGFCIGALLCEVRGRLSILANSKAAQLISFATTLSLVLFADQLPGAAFAAPLVFALLVATLADDSGPIASFFQNRLAQYLGRISYPLYLSHGAMFFPLVAVTWGVPLSGRIIPYSMFLFWAFASAHLLNKYVEIPCRDRFNGWARIIQLPRKAPGRAAS